MATVSSSLQRLLQAQEADQTSRLFGPDLVFPCALAFRTDTDISKNKSVRERELQAWQPSGAGASSPPPTGTHPEGLGDELTFGPGSSANASWDQFAANEQMFGVITSFDEEVYTTRLDRTSADYKEKERKAQRIASEILSVCLNCTGSILTCADFFSQGAINNPHIAEERNVSIDDSGMNEEDKCVDQTSVDYDLG